MTELLNWIMDSIRAYGPWSVFIGVIIESVIVPIPSPLVIMGAGFILINPQFSAPNALIPILLLIVLPGSVASTLGAYIGYGIGYLGGKPLVERWQGFLGFGWREVEAMERRFRAGHVNASLFFLRALPIFPLSIISAAAGLIRLPLRQFSLWTFYGTVPRCLFLGYLGWWMGETYHQIAYGIDRAETMASVLLLGAIMGLVLWLRGKVRGKILKET
ncbi:MAG: VTT domain-containing protein [Deltaproteobacteria bacterium]|nr:VTT domain-containing protein [Deltaproteobacteria bacterium]